MHDGIDAARQAADHRRARAGQIRGDEASRLLAVGRGVSRAHHRYSPIVIGAQVTTDIEHRGWVVDRHQAFRVARVVPRQDVHARAGGSRHLSGQVEFAARPHQIRQRPPVKPNLAQRIRRPLRVLSLVFFASFVVGALAMNWDFFLKYVERVVLFVFLLNAFALLTGYLTAKVAHLPEADRRAVALEVGIQNSGFGLVLVFNFFGGLGGMAIVAAWWGIWHIVVGTSLAAWWRRHPPTPLPAGVAA